jgi:hypothetical protein
VIEDESSIKKIEELVEDICGDLEGPGTGILFTIPVDYVKGLRRRDE